MSHSQAEQASAEQGDADWLRCTYQGDFHSEDQIVEFHGVFVSQRPVFPAIVAVVSRPRARPDARLGLTKSLKSLKSVVEARWASSMTIFRFGPEQ